MDASLGPPGPPLREHSPHSADPSKPYVGREAFKSLIDQTFLSLGREFDTNFDDLLLSEKTLLESTVAVQNHKRATKALENEVAQMKQTVGNPKDAQIERKEGQRRKVLSDNFCQTDPVSEFGLKDKSSPSKSLNLGVSQRSRRSAGGNATFQEEDEVMVSQSKPERRVTRSRTVAVSELHKTDRLAALTLELPGGVSGRGSANAPPQAAPRARRASVEDPDDISTVNLLGQNEALKGRVREYEKRIASLEAREKSLDMEKKKLLWWKLKAQSQGMRLEYPSNIEDIILAGDLTRSIYMQQSEPDQGPAGTTLGEVRSLTDLNSAKDGPKKGHALSTKKGHKR